jgi:chromosome segregation ATPase
MNEEKVRFTVQMPRSLREDAKKSADHGDLSNEIRKLFRHKAYGLGDGETTTELDETEAKLKSVREDLDNLRERRNDLESKISSKEAKENRLVEKLDRLKQEREDRSQTIEVLENMLYDGQRIFMERIKNYADVSEGQAIDMQQELKDRNPDVPDEAFELSEAHEPTNWIEATDY